MSDQAFNEAEEASSLLQMARQLHEQHVSAAREEAERIVSTAQAEATKLVDDATEESSRIRSEAQEELSQLQTSIAEAKEFEGSYRESIRSYLTNLLSEVDEADEVPIPATLIVVEEETLEHPEVIDPDNTFEDDAMAARTFDLLAEPDSNAEDVAFTTETPVEEQPEEVASYPSFDAPSFNEETSNEVTDEDAQETDSVDDLLAAEAQVAADTQAIQVIPTEDVEELQNESSSDQIDSLIESISDIDGAEVDNDGSSSTDSNETEEVVEAAEEATALDTPAEDVESPAEDDNDAQKDSGSLESFDSILAAKPADEDEETEEKPRFSFFGKK